ncbi:Dabb family protein [Candidatus Sulfurimonas baltica]|uniref:Dabb family protein n=1 Tax=Candidatus Sulfurimonas baltica TaxID=2740404 RepID=A0A7S7RNW5_9BACT|nr:Dabb family protein [Candidatus Sulfurimonas baltica]QOY52860.1 Dabb family protein [Candidatus Sulfurimonas baltica]
MIVHIVMFKFKEENRDSNIEEVVKRLNSLVELIPTLKSMEVGVDFSRTERAFDMSLYSTFDTKEDLQAYAVHPEHLKVVELIKSVTLESKVVDYVL